MNLSELEMLNLWKLHHGYSTPRRDCALERDDDAELDSLLLDEMRAWYANLLLTASPDLLPVEDVSEDCTVTKMAEGMVEMKLPCAIIFLIQFQKKCHSQSQQRFGLGVGSMDLS